MEERGSLIIEIQGLIEELDRILKAKDVKQKYFSSYLIDEKKRKGFTSSNLSNLKSKKIIEKKDIDQLRSHKRKLTTLIKFAKEIKDGWKPKRNKKTEVDERIKNIYDSKWFVYYNKPNKKRENEGINFLARGVLEIGKSHDEVTLKLVNNTYYGKINFVKVNEAIINLILHRGRRELSIYGFVRDIAIFPNLFLATYNNVTPDSLISGVLLFTRNDSAIDSDKAIFDDKMENQNKLKTVDNLIIKYFSKISGKSPLGVSLGVLDFKELENETNRI